MDPFFSSISSLDSYSWSPFIPHPTFDITGSCWHCSLLHFHNSSERFDQPFSPRGHTVKGDNWQILLAGGKQNTSSTFRGAQLTSQLEDHIHIDSYINISIDKISTCNIDSYKHLNLSYLWSQPFIKKTLQCHSELKLWIVIGVSRPIAL
jgi:hypothetical protein